MNRVIKYSFFVITILGTALNMIGGDGDRRSANISASHEYVYTRIVHSGSPPLGSGYGSPPPGYGEEIPHPPSYETSAVTAHPFSVSIPEESDEQLALPQGQDADEDELLAIERASKNDVDTKSRNAKAKNIYASEKMYSFSVIESSNKAVDDVVKSQQIKMSMLEIQNEPLATHRLRSNVGDEQRDIDAQLRCARERGEEFGENIISGKHVRFCNDVDTRLVLSRYDDPSTLIHALLYAGTNAIDRFSYLEEWIEYLGDVNEPLIPIEKKNIAMIAAREGASLDVWKYLIFQGADLSCTDKKRCTALMYAVSNNGQEDVIEYMIDHGSNINAQDRDGFTALIHAVANDASQECIQCLIECGANPFLQAKRGGQAIDATDNMLTKIYLSGAMEAYARRQRLGFITADGHGARIRAIRVHDELSPAKNLSCCDRCVIS